jgi:hypothetical protein
MFVFLTRIATPQSSSFPIVLTRLDGTLSKLNPLLKIVEVQWIELATSWLLVIHADHSANEVVTTVIVLPKKRFPYI